MIIERIINKMNILLLLPIFFFTCLGCEAQKLDISENKKAVDAKEVMKSSEVAILGGGCFCVLKQYLKVEGVQQVVSGYAGGKSKNPTYKEICTGLSGHAEVIKVTYDSKIITYQN